MLGINIFRIALLLTHEVSKEKLEITLLRKEVPGLRAEEKNIPRPGTINTLAMSTDNK